MLSAATLYRRFPFKRCFVILAIKMKTYLVVCPNKAIEVIWPQSSAGSIRQRSLNSGVLRSCLHISKHQAAKEQINLIFPLIPVNISDLSLQRSIWLTVELFTTLHVSAFSIRGAVGVGWGRRKNKRYHKNRLKSISSIKNNRCVSYCYYWPTKLTVCSASIQDVD